MCFDILVAPLAALRWAQRRRRLFVDWVLNLRSPGVFWPKELHRSLTRVFHPADDNNSIEGRALGRTIKDDDWNATPRWCFGHILHTLARSYGPPGSCATLKASDRPIQWSPFQLEGRGAPLVLHAYIDSLSYYLANAQCLHRAHRCSRHHWLSSLFTSRPGSLCTPHPVSSHKSKHQARTTIGYTQWIHSFVNTTEYFGGKEYRC